MKRRFSKALRKALAVSLTLSMVVSVPVVANADSTTDTSTINLTDGLTAYYTFNDTLANSVTGGKASLHGGSGTTWNGGATISAPVYATGKNGNAYSFEGNTDDASGNGLELDVKTSDTGAFTISLWVNTEEKVGYQPIFFSNIDGDNYVTAGTFYNNFASGGLVDYKTAWTWLDKGGTAKSTLQDLVTGEWAYVTLTMESDGTATLYYNAEELDCDKISDYSEDPFTSMPIFLGINWWDRSFKGLMDDVVVYDRALSEDEVVALYEKEGNPLDTDTNTLELLEQISQAEALIKSLYTAESYSAVSEALEVAKSAKTSTDQNEIDSAAANLKLAIGNLVEASEVKYSFSVPTTTLAADTCKKISNPLKDKNAQEIEISYTINWDSGAAKNGWDGIFSFYDTETKGRVSFHTAPYLCYNNQLEGELFEYIDYKIDAWCASNCETGKDYTFKWVISADELKVYCDDTEITGATDTTNGTGYEGVLTMINTCDVFSVGVGDAATSFWSTEKCNVSIEVDAVIKTDSIVEVIGAQKNDSGDMAFVTTISSDEFNSLNGSNSDGITGMGVYLVTGEATDVSKIVSAGEKVATHYVVDAATLDNSLDSGLYAFRSIITNASDADTYTAVPYVRYTDSNGYSYTAYGAPVTRTYSGCQEVNS